MNKNALEFWKLHDVLTLHEAASLIVGVSPSDINVEQHPEYEAVIGALIKAVVCLAPRFIESPSDYVVSSLRARCRDVSDSSCFIEVAHVDGLDYSEQREIECSKKDLIEWLDDKGLHPPFFFPDEQSNTPNQSPQELYKTNLMQLLEDAAQALWKGVDPNDPHKPTNEVVARWLEDEAEKRGLGHIGKGGHAHGGLSEKYIQAVCTIINPQNGNIKDPNL